MLIFEKQGCLAIIDWLNAIHTRHGLAKPLGRFRRESHTDDAIAGGTLNAAGAQSRSVVSPISYPQHQ